PRRRRAGSGDPATPPAKGEKLIMATMAFDLTDEEVEALETASNSRGCNRAALVRDLVQRFLRTEQLRHAVESEGPAALYDDEMAAEDVALAEEGMDDYARLLREADES